VLARSPRTAASGDGVSFVQLTYELSSTHGSSAKALYYERCFPIMERFLIGMRGRRACADGRLRRNPDL
jgi:hypothetical protein